MKIISIEVLTCDAGWRPWSFIKITTNTNLVGYSECTDSHGSPQGIVGIIEDLKKVIIGKNPLAFEKLYWELYKATRQSPGSIIQKAIGGIENALLDIVGKHLGVPVYALFGGAVRTEIPLYWSHWATTRIRANEITKTKQIKNLEDLTPFIKETKQKGFTAVKTNIAILEQEPFIYMPGFGKSPGGPELNVSQELLNNIVTYIGRIRKIAGDDFGIMLDLNFNFKTDGYIKIARALEPFNLTWLEMDTYDPKALRYIRDSISTPICSGENLYTNRQFKPYFDNYAMDVASVDVIWNGFVQSKKIADLAEMYEVNVTPHNYYSHLATFISAHFAAVIPNLKNLEVDIDDVPWKDDLVTEIPDISQGVLKLSDKPGWGVDINEEVLRKHPYKRA